MAFFSRRSGPFCLSVLMISVVGTIFIMAPMGVQQELKQEEHYGDIIYIPELDQKVTVQEFNRTQPGEWTVSVLLKNGKRIKIGFETVYPNGLDNK